MCSIYKEGVYCSSIVQGSLFLPAPAAVRKVGNQLRQRVGWVLLLSETLKAMHTYSVPVKLEVPACAGAS